MGSCAEVLSDGTFFNAQLHLQKSDVESVLTGRIMYNFLPTFGAKNMDKKLELSKIQLFFQHFGKKKLERKLDGFHITGNPLLSQDQNGCLTFMRQPLSIFYLYYQVAEVAAGG